MMQRRRLVFITAAGLITALASLYMAGLSLWRVWGIRLTVDAVCVLMENLGLTLCALLMLAFSLASCWKDRRPGAFCLVCVAAYVLLSTGILYAAGDLRGYPAALKPVERWMALWCMLLLPLPQIYICRCQFGATLRLTLALVCVVLVSTLVVAITLLWGVFSIRAAELCAVAAMLLVFAAQLYLLLRRFITRNYKHLPTALTAGSVVLAAGYLAAAVRFATHGWPNGLPLYRYALLGYMLCAMMHGARGEAEPEDELGELETLRAREEEYRIAAGHSRKCIIRFDITARRVRYQPETAAFLGLPEEMENMPEALVDMGRIEAHTIDAYRRFHNQILQGEPSGSGVFGYCTAQGKPVWMHADFTTVFDRQSRPLHSIISCYELTGMREREAAYEKWRQTYRDLVQDACTYYEVNLTCDTLLNEWGGLLPRLPRDLSDAMTEAMDYVARTALAPEDRDAFLRMVNREHLLGLYAQDVRRETFECRRVQGSVLLWTRAGVQMLSDPYSSDVRAFVLLLDIEEEKRREACEKKRAMTDELTGLLSRTSFIERFEDLCRSDHENARHAVVMLDLDGFKAVNDTFGHQFGDRVLVDVAGEMRAMMRGNDLIGRFGGDEFMLCLKNVPKDGSFLEHRCRTICRVLSKQFGEDVAMSASLGVALYPTDGKSFDELYQCADQALYHAKQRGRNGFVFYDRTQAPATAPSHGILKAQELSPSVRSQSAHRHTLLIVDDQPINRAILREIFCASYDLLEASNGREALDTLRNAPQTISAMLLDLLMPEVSGLDVLEEMNGDAYYQTIPVIVVSAADEEEYSLKAIELGAVDFVTKPIDERLVRLRVRNAIFRRETENLRAQNRELLVQRAGETRHQNQLRYLAEHDSLTHICNKNAFYRKTRAMLDGRPDAAFCIVTFDIQRFRAVNDIFGHEEGDRLLRFIAMQLRNDIGQDGTYSRVDTDHFSFCIPYDPDGLPERIRRLMDGVRGYDLSFEVLLTFGVFLIDDREMPVGQMYDRAEMARRTVKDSYLSRWAFYDDTMREKLMEEQEIISHMNAALEGGEFIVHYQPKCRLDTGAIVGAEALVRWNHSTRGLLSPSEFVPIFEKNGFIMKLDIYVWEQACAFLSRRLQAVPADPLRISVNLSRANLYNPGLCRTLDGLCRRYGVPNSRMEVEITESAYVENAHLLLGLTDELHRFGFTVEMDDFGSGYSSLNMLKEIPVDVLKLDIRLLSGLDSGGRGSDILRSIVQMARQLRLQVVAEGVERESQARFLAEIGCGLAQGYYYARPMTEEDFTRTLSQRSSIEDFGADDMSGAQARLDSLLCSAALCGRADGRVRLLCVNEYYLRMMRGERETFEEVDAQLERWAGPQDMRLLKDAMDTALESGAACECVYLQRDLGDRHHLLRAAVRHLFDEGENGIYLITFVDISDGNG